MLWHQPLDIFLFAAFLVAGILNIHDREEEGIGVCSPPCLPRPLNLGSGVALPLHVRINMLIDETQVSLRSDGRE